MEFEFEAKIGLEINVSDVLGWIEGFKAVSDLYSVASGEFSGSNSIAADNPEIISSDPYGDGWLYSINGKPDPMAVDVQGYIGHLDLTIDKMLEKPWQTPEIGSS